MKNRGQLFALLYGYDRANHSDDRTNDVLVGHLSNHPKNLFCGLLFMRIGSVCACMHNVSVSVLAKRGEVTPYFAAIFGKTISLTLSGRFSMIIGHQSYTNIFSMERTLVLCDDGGQCL